MTSSEEVRAYISALFEEGRVNDELRRTDPEAYKRKMEAQMPENRCCLCRQTFRGYGNNPQPILEEGVACDTCDVRIVLKARMQAVREPDV